MFQFKKQETFTEKAFNDFLKKRGISASVLFDFDVAIISRDDLDKYENNLILASWTSFYQQSEKTLVPVVVDVLSSLNNDEVSKPFSVGDDFWVLKKNSSRVEDLPDKALLFKEMQSSWMGQASKEVLSLIKNNAVKTIFNN
jgi:hypothetical protein